MGRHEQPRHRKGAITITAIDGFDRNCQGDSQTVFRMKQFPQQPANWSNWPIEEIPSSGICLRLQKRTRTSVNLAGSSWTKRTTISALAGCTDVTS